MNDDKLIACFVKKKHAIINSGASCARSVYIADIDVMLAALFFFTIGSGAGPIVAVIRYVVIAYLFLKYLRSFRFVAPLGILLIGYSVILFFSTYTNTGSITFAISGFMHGITCIIVFLVFIQYAHKNGSRQLLRLLFHFYLVFLIMTDFLLVVYPYDFDKANEIFLIGNKFTVAYCHCFVAGIAFVLYGKKPLAARFLILLAATVSLVVSCTTGFIMSCVMFLLSLLPSRVKVAFANPLALFVLILILNILMWGDFDLLHNEIVQGLLTNTFDKSPNLTGRDALYNATLGFVADRPLFGYGYLTNIYRDTFGYGNAQNGVFHIITQAGVVGAIFYFAALLKAMLSMKDDESVRKKYYGITMYLYALAIGSLVEINLSMTFVIGVAVLVACGNPLLVSRRYKKSTVAIIDAYDKKDIG